jgi:porin
MHPLSLLLLCIALIYISPGIDAREYLLDDWRFGRWELTGPRRELKESGIEPALILTVDYAKPVAGGSDHDAAVMGNVDLVLDIDAEKTLGWTGAKFFIYALGNHHHTAGDGEFLTDKIGNAQVTSNIEAPSAAKIYELWYDQTFLSAESGRSWSLRMGLYDLNSEFDVIESAAGLINSSFGIGPDFAQSGQNGPSIFPSTSLALRLRYVGNKGVYAQYAVLDGVPGDPDNERGTHVQFNDGDGALQVLEAGLAQEADVGQRHRKIALGFWRYNPQQTQIAADELDAEVKTSRNAGYYVIGEYQLMQESADKAQGLCVFLRYGRANDDINAIATYTGAGASYVGLLDGRDADQLSFGVAVAHFGDTFINAERAAGNEATREEWVYELSYRVQLSPWFALQPDVQLIRDPFAGGDDVTLALLRAEVVF